MTDKTKLYSGSELAQEFQVTPQALRFYEDKGLLKPARSGRTRVYAYRDRVRLLLIQRLRRLGFSLDDIVEFISLYGSGDEQFEYGLEKVRARLSDLRQMQDEIQQTIAELETLEQEAAHRLAESRKEKGTDG